MAATSTKSLTSANGAPPARLPACTRILGIDPGLQRTGYAMLACGATEGEVRLIDAGIIRLDRTQELAARLVELDAALSELMSQHRPTLLACEELYAHYKHPRTAILMGHARGVILSVAARRDVRICAIAATHAKKLLTGRGHAGKAQMQRAVALTLGLVELPEPHDVADAIAIGLAGARLLTAETTLAEAGA